MPTKDTTASAVTIDEARDLFFGPRDVFEEAHATKDGRVGILMRHRGGVRRIELPADEALTMAAALAAAVADWMASPVPANSTA